MTRSTSSRSAKATPSPAPEPEDNGTPDESIEPLSASIWGSTTWTIHKADGSVWSMEIQGGKGRVSYSRGPRHDGEARFYRSESAKHYDAVISGVTDAYSDRCRIEPVPKIAKMTSSPSAAPSSSWSSLTKAEKAKWTTRAGVAGWAKVRDYYEANAEDELVLTPAKSR